MSDKEDKGVPKMAVILNSFAEGLMFVLLQLAMARNLENSQVLNNVETIHDKPTKAAPWRYEFAYNVIFTLLYFHLTAAYGVYLMMTSVKIATILLNFIIYILAGIGVTAGAHRLWSHRSYKAKPPLQLMLMLFQSMAFQFSVVNWVKEHRLHHKYCDTDADPHNASRGFFFAHIGWVMVKEHDEMKKYMKVVDISDVRSNPILRFQEKFAYPVIITMCFILPTVLPMILWGETFSNAWHISVLRFILSLHATFLINSAAHKFGNKPYDSRILPTQNNFVSLVICGEGFHNYHHTFPWDYRAAELGNNILNLSTHFINLCAHIGWAYDLKTANEEYVRAKANKTGDGSDSWGRPRVLE